MLEQIVAITNVSPRHWQPFRPFPLALSPFPATFVARRARSWACWPSPSTRLQPVLKSSRWGDWDALLAEALADRVPLEMAVRSQKATLVFELWGHRNPHLVRYDEPLRLTLHTAIRHQKPLSYRRLLDMAGRYGFDLVPTLAVAEPDPEGLARAYRQLQAQMEARNAAAGADVFIDEGAILVLSTIETAVYWKCKPPSIEEIHWTADAHVGKEHVQFLMVAQ